MADTNIPRLESPRNAFVYVFRSGTGLLKVGISKDPKERLRALLTGHPFNLEIIYLLECDERLALPIERGVHMALTDCRVQGEWFQATPKKATEAIVLVLNILLLTDKMPPRAEWRWKGDVPNFDTPAESDPYPGLRHVLSGVFMVLAGAVFLYVSWWSFRMALFPGFPTGSIANMTEMRAAFAIFGCFSFCSALLAFAVEGAPIVHKELVRLKNKYLKQYLPYLDTIYRGALSFFAPVPVVALLHQLYLAGNITQNAFTAFALVSLFLAPLIFYLTRREIAKSGNTSK